MGVARAVFVVHASMRRLLAVLTAGAVIASACIAAEQVAKSDSVATVTVVRMKSGDAAEPQSVRGRLLVEAADGGLLLETSDGRLVTVKPAELVEREATAEPFTLLNADELGAHLLKETGPGFEIVRTEHYVIATNAGRPYAQWCGKLFERLQSGFRLYFRKLGLDLPEPAAPLPAIVFATAEQFADYATREAGPSLARAKGFYSIRTNRMVLADLTRSESGEPARNAAEMQRRLDAAVLNVTTVVHEATHQIAFNCGLQTRYADNPLWLSEGIAMFFEAPDLKSTTGWTTIGKAHPGRLAKFQEYARERRPAGSLTTLLASDERFRDPATTSDAYSESWALTYFLIREHREEFAEYLRTIGGKPRLIWDNEDKRLEEFEQAFGGDATALEQEFLRYAGKLRGAR